MIKKNNHLSKKTIKYDKQLNNLIVGYVGPISKTSTDKPNWDLHRPPSPQPPTATDLLHLVREGQPTLQVPENQPEPTKQSDCNPAVYGHK